MERKDQHADRAACNAADDEHVEDLEPSPEDADAVRGGFKEATGFDSESEVVERARG